MRIERQIDLPSFGSMLIRSLDGCSKRLLELNELNKAICSVSGSAAIDDAVRLQDRLEFVILFVRLLILLLLFMLLLLLLFIRL